MTNAMKVTIDRISGARKDRSPCSIDAMFQQERLDDRAGREYLPMDVYVDPRTIRQHFQGSSFLSP